jgi:hypothetical protein
MALRWCPIWRVAAPDPKKSRIHKGSHRALVLREGSPDVTVHQGKASGALRRNPSKFLLPRQLHP